MARPGAKRRQPSARYSVLGREIQLPSYARRLGRAGSPQDRGLSRQGERGSSSHSVSTSSTGSGLRPLPASPRPGALDLEAARMTSGCSRGAGSEPCSHRWGWGSSVRVERSPRPLGRRLQVSQGPRRVRGCRPSRVGYRRGEPAATDVAANRAPGCAVLARPTPRWPRGRCRTPSSRRPSAKRSCSPDRPRVRRSSARLRRRSRRRR